MRAANWIPPCPTASNMIFSLASKSSGRFVPVNEMGMHHLVKDYDPRYVAAVWDPAHNALEGMNSDSALDVLAPRLCVVNLKNAYWRRVSGAGSRSRRVEDLLDLRRAGSGVLAARYRQAAGY